MSEKRTITVDAKIIEPGKMDDTFDIVFSSEGVDFTHTQRVDVRERQSIYWEHFQRVATVAFKRFLNSDVEVTFSN